jgi:predicted DNA-binding transcriptional regulator YafY
VRASRLLAILFRLQASGPATAEALAGELEVSVRTIYRDVAALQSAGVPLWTETGPGGGIRLLDGWRSRLDGLTADEAGALFLAGAPGSAVAELGLGTVLAAAQAKVLATLPPELRHRAGRVRQRFLLDAPGWFHLEEERPHLALVADAVWSERRIDVRYRRGRDRTVARRLDPLGLVLKGGTWYLVARHRADVRTYRVSRLSEASARDERFVRPDDFDLAAWWAASTAEFDRSILRERVRLRLSPAAARSLGWFVDATAATEALAAAGPPDGEGWLEVDLAVEEEAVAAGQLLALGDGVEVLAPASLRSAIAATGRRMAALNAAGARPRRPG